MTVRREVLIVFVVAAFVPQFAHGVPPVTDGLVAHWGLDEGGGTTIFDSIGTNDGWVEGAQWVTGITGKALSFDGSGYAEIPDSPELRPYNHRLSVALWINPLYQGGSPHVTIIRKGIGCYTAGWGIDCDGATGSNPIWFWGLPADPQHTLIPSWRAQSSAAIAIGEWQFIAGTADGTVVKIYVNGEVSGQSPIDTSREVYNEHSITVGANYANCGYWHNHYKGAIDEVMLYDKALSDCEILALYHQHAPRLYVVIPGVCDDGKKMIAAASAMSDSPGPAFTIAESEGWGDDAIRDVVTGGAENAKLNGWDLIINIDMNLEGPFIKYITPTEFTRWEPATQWAAQVANIVSEEFTKVVPCGCRILYAHSAGSDAVFKSVRDSAGKGTKKMYGDIKEYDDINILNGRTGANELSQWLDKRGYKWSQVKVFTSQGDIWAAPPTPWGGGSIANKDGAAEKARQGAWVHIHCNKVWTGVQWVKPDHNTLRDYYSNSAEFEVYTQTVEAQPYQASFIDAMQKDWTLP